VELGSLTKTHAYFVANNIQIGLRVYKGPGKDANDRRVQADCGR
jgi:hypothetical protein